jgi:hypothetical protein
MMGTLVREHGPAVDRVHCVAPPAAKSDGHCRDIASGTNCDRRGVMSVRAEYRDVLGTHLCGSQVCSIAKDETDGTVS